MFYNLSMRQCCSSISQELAEKNQKTIKLKLEALHMPTRLFTRLILKIVNA